LKLSNLEEDSKKVEVLKTALIAVHQEANKLSGADVGKILLIVEECFDKLHMQRVVNYER
jgi:hypothetical protein